MAQTLQLRSKEAINVKLLLIGDSSVGKTCLLLRFTDKQWLREDEASTTIGVEFRAHKMEIKGQRVKMNIWDTAGQEQFRSVTPLYYRGAQGAILVYDVSNRGTFEALPRWLEELENHAPPEAVKIVVGNKLDKESSRQVPTDEGAAFAHSTGCLFVEASAKTAVGVKEAFSQVVERIMDTPELWAEKPNASSSRAPDLLEAHQEEEADGCSC